MTKRPISITVFSWLCIVFGVGGFLINFDLYWLGPLPTLNFGSKPFGMIIHMLDPYAWRVSLYPHHWYSDMHPLAMWLFPAQWLFLAVCGGGYALWIQLGALDARRLGRVPPPPEPCAHAI